MNREIEMLQKQVKGLKLMVGSLFGVILVALCFAFTTKTKFTEINVERINIVEKNGDLKMVISNKERQHPGRMEGKDLAKRTREPGIIFFNGNTDECGGLVYDSDKESAGLVISVDKYKDDQVMQLQYNEDFTTHERKYGIQFWTYGKENAFKERGARFKELSGSGDAASRKKAIDQMRAEGLVATDRLFVGKTFKDDVGVFVNDAMGKPRIRLYVDRNNKAKIEVLDENGKVVK